MSRIRFLAMAFCSVLVITACGSGGDGVSTTAVPTSTTVTTAVPVTTTTTSAPPTTASPSTTTTATPSTTLASADGAEGSGCTPGTSSSLPDGLWFGYVVSMGDQVIEFDLACWFTGQAANDAAAEDGEESPPPNDYYVRNQSEATRDITVAADSNVVFYPTGDPQGAEDGDFEEWRAVMEERGAFFGVWLEIVGGEAVSIEEQWVP